MCLKASAIENANLFLNEGRVQGALCKNIYLAGLLRRCIYLRYYKPHSLLKVKGDMVKTGCFEKRLLWRVPFVFLSEGKISSL